MKIQVNFLYRKNFRPVFNENIEQFFYVEKFQICI